MLDPRTRRITRPLARPGLLARFAAALLLVIVPGASGLGSPQEPAGPVVPVPGCGGQAVLASAGHTWMCTWSDEFDGTALGPVWSPIPYGLGSSCLFAEAPYVRVANGNLELTAMPLPEGHACTERWGLEYGGGGIQTQGAFSQSYGRFEIRASLPPGAGFWPAFWLLPDDDSFDGEIDILEVYGGRGSTGDVTVRTPAAGPGPHHTCQIDPAYSDGFHTYALEWSPDRMLFLYDGTVCADFTGMSDDGTTPPAFPPTFTKPYHVLLNLAIQPYWPPDTQTPFPGTMLVDYLRVWRQA